MSAWTALTTAAVINALPTDLAALYATWLEANPAKASRLGEIVAEIIAVYRNAVQSNAQNAMDAEADTVPTSGFRHALNNCIFQLGMEMGIAFAPEVSGLQQESEIWLRMVQSGTIAPVGLHEGSPTYTSPEDREPDTQERMLCGV